MQADISDNRHLLLSMIHAGWTASCVHVAAKLGIADALSASPATAEEVAQKINGKAEATFRFLRALSSIGITRQLSDRRFVITDLGKLLSSNSPGGLRSYASTFGTPEFQQVWFNLEDLIKGGSPVFSSLFGESFYEHLSVQPAFAGLFSEAMREKYQGVVEEITGSYDFSCYSGKTIVDVGGGYGHLVEGILKRASGAQGVCVDLPEVINGVAGLREKNSKVEFVAGDCMQEIPQGDLHVMKSFIVIRGDDQEALQLLRRSRASIAKSGTLLIIEPILAGPNEVDEAPCFDLHIFALHNGKLRSLDEYESLLNKADYKLTSTTKLPSGFTIIEAKPLIVSERGFVRDL